MSRHELGDYLNEQVSLLALPPDLEVSIRRLIEQIDEDGYLKKPLEVVEKEHGESFSGSVDWSLRVLQGLKPAGVGARNLRECLLLQLAEKTPHRDLVIILISSHLIDVQEQRFEKIQEQTARGMEEISAAIDILKTLNPRPGRMFGR